MLRIGFAERIERVEHVGWKGKMVLEVGGTKSLKVRHGKFRHPEAVIVRRKFGCIGLLERIERGNEKPHFIDQALLNERLGQRSVAFMWRIERAAVDSYFQLFIAD